MKNVADEMNALKGTVDASKKMESSTGAVQVNAPVNAPISVKIEGTPTSKKTELDVRKAAEEWFDHVVGLCPPVRIKDPEGIAKRYYELRDGFITKVDREYDELPHKSVLYDILDTLKKEQNYR